MVKRIKAFLLRSKTREGYLHLPLLFNIVLEVLARAIKKGKEMKYTKIEKEEINCFYS